MAKDKIETLAEQLMNLTPQESEKLAIVIKAKMMPEVEKQRALLEEQNRNPQTAQMGQRQAMPMQPPTTRDVAMRGLLR